MALRALKIKDLERGLEDVSELRIESIVIGRKSRATESDIAYINNMPLYALKECLIDSINKLIAYKRPNRYYVNGKIISCFRIGPVRDFSRRSYILKVPILDCIFIDGKISDEI